MIDELKRRARAGDMHALQELRERGFFGSAAAPARSYELSAAQRRMWILDQSSGVRSAYNISRALTIHGELDRASLGGALNAVIGRHESLRTTFTTVGDEPRQVVHAPAPFTIAYADLRGEADPPGAATLVAGEDAPRPFNLSTGPLFRVHLLRTGDAEHVLLFNAHHIVCDAWSLDNIVRELTSLYRGDTLPPLVRQYKDFAVWHNEWLRSAQGDDARRFWHRALAAPLPTLDLPTDHSRAAASSWAGRSISIDLGQHLTAGLNTLAINERTTVFTALIAITKALLHLESGQEDIIVGSPIAGRDHAEVEPLIGVFANAVALRDRVTAATTVRGLVRRVRRTIEGAFAHQGMPFDVLVNELAVDRAASRSPIFDVLVGLLNTGRSALELGGLALSEFETGTEQVPHDLTLYFAEGSGSLHLSVLYRTDLFDEASIRRLLDRWVRVAERAVASPELRVDELDTEAALHAHRERVAMVNGIAVDLDRLAGQIVRDARVADAIVLRHTDALVAFVVSGDGAPPETVRSRVMALGVSRVVTVSTLPLTGDGHINVRCLERLADESLRSTSSSAAEPPLHAWDLVPRKATRTSAEPPRVRLDSKAVEDDRETPAISIGADLLIGADAPWTLGESLIKAARSDSTLTYVSGDGAEQVATYATLADEARRIATSIRAAGAKPGAPVILLLTEPREVLPALWGAIFAGVVPLIASPPPDFASSSRQLDHLAHLWTLLERPLIVTTRALAQPVLSLSRLFDVTQDHVLVFEDLRLGAPIDAIHDADPDDVAFFSLTSGSTGRPKCVMLTHRNALARARGMNQLCGCVDEVVLNWLPLDHIGSLSKAHLRCVDLACSAVYMTPAMVLGDPLQWLAGLDRYRITHSWAPNFAYALVTEALRARDNTAALAYDLSCVKRLVSGGEAVTPSAVDAFTAALAPFGLSPSALQPAYGMAEMASGVTYAVGEKPGQQAWFHRIDRASLSGRLRPAPDPANAATYADVGPPIAGVSLRIVDEIGAPLPEWRIGRVQVMGPPIAKGYYRDPEATRAVFFPDGWFDTGDHGFLANGRLALTGRAKDGIIVNGANYSSAEIESAVESLAGVATSFAAAAAVRPSGQADESLAIFYVPNDRKTVTRAGHAIREAVLEKVGIKPDYLIPLRADQIPKTAIGKIQRPQLVKQFEAGLFDEVVQHTDVELGGERTHPNWFGSRTWHPAQEGARKEIGAPSVIVGGDPTLAAQLSARLQIAVAACSDLTQLLDRLQPMTVTERQQTVLVVTVGGQALNAGDQLVSDFAAWAALIMSLAQECPWLDLRVVDLEPGDTEANVSRCIDELGRAGGARISAWRRGRRFEPRLSSADVAIDPASAPPFSTGALILVSGGSGGIGRHLVRYLRDEFDARVLVTGRHSTADRTAPSDPLVLYRQADVCDRASVDAAVDAAERAFARPLSGAFHLAGVLADRPLANEQHESLTAVYRPKAVGAVTLADVVRTRAGANGVLVTFSSANGLFGGVGASAYSAANAFVDAFADHLRLTGQLRSWNLAWSMWDDTGMSRGFALRDATRAKGFAVLRPEVALTALDAVLRRPPASVWIGLDLANPRLSSISDRTVVELKDARDDDGATRVAPRSDAERRLARIWEDLLGVSNLAIDDHFIRLGGHSLKATQLVARIQKEFDTKVSLQDVFRVPTIAGLAAVVDAGTRRNFASIEPTLPAAHYPVSHSQRRLWVIEQMGLAGPAYHIESATALDGAIDEQALRHAVETVVLRHEALRTTFADIDGEPRQIVHSTIDNAFASVDVSNAHDPDNAAREMIRTASATPFDLTTGPLFRVVLYRLSSHRAALVLTMHHIVSDGWSMGVIVRELLEGYERASRGDTSTPAPLRIHYKDFAAWQERAIVDDEAGHRAFWLEALAGDLPVLDLPADRPRPPVQSFRGSVVEMTIDAATGNAVRRLAQQHGATPFMAWLAIVRLLVFRYTRAEDVVIGTPVAGREHVDLADQVGFYVNMLPLRTSVSDASSAARLLDQIKRITTNAIAHQLYPYDRLVEELSIRRDAGRNPLFDVVVSVLEAEETGRTPAGVRATAIDLEALTSKFDVTFFFSEAAGGAWQLVIEYNTDLFTAERIERMAVHLAILASSVAQKPDVPVRELDLLRVEERDALIARFPIAPSEYPREKSIAAVFEAQVNATPDHVAALSAQGSLTYRELDALANGLAATIIARGVGIEEPIGVLMAPSEWIAVAVIGILKAGAAYVPLDPSHPAARRDLMLADAGCRIVVGDRDTASAITSSTIAFIDVRSVTATDVRVPVAQDASHLAYIMFTSGSTGRPKGTLIEQRSVVRLVKGTNFLQLGPDDRVLQTSSPAFDASTFEMWGALLNGGCLCVPASKEILEPDTIAARLREWRVTAMWCTAGLFNQLVDANVGMFAGLRAMIAGGDRLSPVHVRRFREALSRVRLINGYGPTENTTFTTFHQISDVEGEIPLGRPVANTSVYVLDANGQPAPIGVRGEICTGGDGLARGYLNDARLTADRFVPHPFEHGARLYRTGDAGRWRADGILEFAGRIDQQLKVRGYRVEPGEIETAIRLLAGIDDALVVARRTSGTLELLAYVIASDTIDARVLRESLSGTLPDYMLPAHWIQLDRFPLTASQKVDRAALPAPEAVAKREPSDRVAPRSEEERALVQTWSELLGGRPGIHDNYFELGGDSIRAIQLASRLRRSGWALRVRDVFTHPTIAALAPLLKPLTGDQRPRRDVAGRVPMTAAQRWFFAHHHGPLQHFNQAVLLKPQRPIEEGPLRTALSALIDQHDALRLMFPVDGETRVAEIRPQGEPAWLEAIDLRGATDAAAQLVVQLDEMHRDFDLEGGPLFRAALVEMPDGQRVWLAAHHLVVDGVSWRVLMEQLSIAYAQAADGGAIALGEPSASFRDRADESAAFALSDTLAKEIAAWDEVEPGLPVEGGANSTYGSSVSVSLSWPADETALLLSSVHHAYSTEINDLLLAGLARALGDWTGDTGTTIDLEGHGREPLLQDLDLSRTVGWFTSIYPVTLPSRTNDRDAIRVVKEALRAIPRRGAGYGIGRYSGTVVAHSLPSISFNYLGQFDQPAGDDGKPALFAFASEPAGTAFGPNLTRAHAFDIVVMVSAGRLSMSVLADERDRDRAQSLIDTFDRTLRGIVTHCLDRPAERTPSDFSASLTLTEYDRLMASRNWARQVEDICDTTPMQEGLLLLSVLAPESRAYRVQMAYMLGGQLDPRRFEDAWRSVCRAHPVLRSAFAHEGLERPLRVVLRDRMPTFAWHDLRHTGAAAQVARIRAARERDLDAALDFERDPLMRFTVFQLADERWKIVWSYHHVLLDGWSLGLVFRDFAQSYGASGEVAAAIPDGADPADYSRWLAQQDPDAARAWWSRYLDGYDQAAVLPPASNNERIAADRDREHTIVLPAEETSALSAIAIEWGVTTATLLQAAWGIVLARYNRAEDVVFGSIVAGRPAEVINADRMVGAFINAVPVRVRSGGAIALRDLATSLQSDLAMAGRFHHVPLAAIQDQSVLGRDLFSHMVIIENYPVERQLADAGRAAQLQITGLEAHDRTHYSFSLTIVPGDQLTVSIQYDAALHDPAQIERTAAHYRRVLNAFGTVATVGGVELMTDQERETVTRRFQPARLQFSGANVVDLLAAQAARAPARIAVTSANGDITYQALADSIEKLGTALANAGAAKGDRVGVLLERSSAIPAALFGVLRAGAAYVPLDPDYPQARLRFMIDDSGCRFLVASDRSLRGMLIDWSWREAARVDDLVLLCNAPRAAGMHTARPTDLDDPAYVMYTSGSTGQPKGVVIPHRALSSQTQWFIDEFAVDERDRFFQKTPISFDASVEEIYGTLLAGGTIVIPRADEHLDPDRMSAALVRDGVTLIQVVPSQLAMMLDAGWSLSGTNVRLLLVGSEPLDAGLLARVPTDWTTKVVNLYGPTETCDNATAWRWDGRTSGRIPIGVPVANTRAFVLDPGLRPVPLGIFGEICLAGDNLATGYHGRPELTADRFVIAPELGERIYRTGDLGRWTDQGVLECAGRIDQQVKIRGHRVEAGEVEAQLRLHTGIQDAAVIIVRSSGQPELVGFVVARSDASPIPSSRELRLWLKERVLEAMVPSRIVPIDRLPLMPNGKVDRRALEALAINDTEPRADRAMPARNANEAAIAQIWAGVLGMTDPDIRDNFFESGGHSLKAMQIVSRIHRDLGVRLSLRDVFDHPTIEGLASLSRPIDRYSAIEPAPKQPTYALSHAQHRLWLLHNIPGGEAAYNMPSAFSIEGAELDLVALQHAFESLIDRHEALRTAFVVIGGEPRQQVLPTAPVTIARIDLRDYADADAKARDLAERDALLPFDLTAPPLLRVTAIAMPGATARTVILLTMHHIVGDGWSGEILEREISALYEAYRAGRSNPLPPLRIQYKDFSEWQNDKTFAADEAWWLSELEGIPDRLILPTDLEPAQDREFRGAVEELVLDADLTAALSALAAQRNITLSHAVLALFMLTLNRLTGQDDVCIGMSVANRNHPDLERLIGFFVNVLPIRTRFASGLHVNTLFDRVAATATAALDRQDYPFDLLVRRLNPERATTRQPLVNVVYAFQNFTDVQMDIGAAAAVPDTGTTMRSFDFEFRTSKFDLTLFVSNQADTLRLTLEYDTGLFTPDTARRYLALLARFVRIATAAEGPAS